MAKNVLPDEFAKPFVKLRYLLDKSGVSFLEKKKIFPLIKYWKFIYVVPICSVFIMSVITYFVKIPSKIDDIIETSNSITIIFVIGQALVKAVTVVYYNKDISYIINELAKLWPKDEDLIETQIATKAKSLKRLNICINVYYGVNMIGSMLYIWAPIFEAAIRVFVLNQDVELLFPFGCAYPFNPTEPWIRYLMVYLFQYFGIIHVVYFLIGTELLIITLAAHLSTLFTLLSSDILILQPVPNESRLSEQETEGLSYENSVCWSKEKGINYIVKRHQLLIKLSNKTDNIFNMVIFTNVTSSTISICFFGFVAKIAKKPSDVAKNLVGVIASILQIFNLCHYGQLLTDASKSLASAVYSSMWYEGGTRFQKTLCLIMFRSQNPCYISSLKYAPVTLTMFTSVMSTTWSYFSLILSVYEEED